MDLAQCESVAHSGNPVLMRIGDYVSSVKQRGMPKRADGAARSVGTHDESSEDGLVEPSVRLSYDVALGHFINVLPGRLEVLQSVRRHNELLALAFLGNEVHREDGLV